MKRVIQKSCLRRNEDCNLTFYQNLEFSVAAICNLQLVAVMFRENGPELEDLNSKCYPFL